MSTDDEETETIPFDPVFLNFKRHKVMISNAIKKPFPFLEVLRDNNLITEKMYTDFKDSCTNLVPVQNVVYRALEELEKKFDPNVLEVLFSPGNLMEYPDLEPIFKDFENGPGDSCCQESLTWSPSGPSSSDEWRSNDGEKTTLTQGNQTENHQFSIPQIHNESCELKVQLSGRDAGLEPHIPWPCSNENLTRDNSDDENICSEESTSVTCQSSKETQRARQAVGICSQEPVNSRNPPTSTNTHRRRGPRDPRQNNVDFNLPELPVTCGSAKGTLYKEKFKKERISTKPTNDEGKEQQAQQS